MGINGLNKFLKKHCPDASYKKTLNDFRGKRFAIDTNIFIYKFKFNNETHWIDTFINFINIFKLYDIDIILVYDNKFPCEKNMKYQRQKKEKESANQYIIKLEEDIIGYKNNGIKTPAIENLFKKYPPGLMSLEGMIEKEKERINKRNIYVTRDEFDQTKQIAQQYNIKIEVPEFEAETFCSELCIDGKVDAVLTNDSDVFAYGVPKCLLDFRNCAGEHYVMEYNFNEILDALDLTFEQFRDFCIICGCDYNSRIKNIGPERAYNLVKKFKSIENIEKNVSFSIEKWNYKRCRELFSLKAREN